MTHSDVSSRQPVTASQPIVQTSISTQPVDWHSSKLSVVGWHRVSPTLQRHVPVVASHRAAASHSSPLSSHVAGPVPGSVHTCGWDPSQPVLSSTHSSQVIWLDGVSEFMHSVLESHVCRFVHPVRAELQICS